MATTIEPEKAPNGPSSPTSIIPNQAEQITDPNEKDLEMATKTITTMSEEPYSIYTHKQKIGIIFTAALISVFSPMGSNIYIPSFNSVAHDMHVSLSLINLTLTTYLIFQGLAPTFVGGFSDSAGRRPAYIICLVIYLAANIALALSPNYACLLIFRAVQASGSSGTVALANAVAADIVTSAERGKYVAYTSVTSILAPSVAPVLGGILSQYAGWRWIFWFCALLAVAAFTPFLIFFPETCRKICGNGSIPPPSLNHSVPSYLYERKQKKLGNYYIFEERDRLAAERKISFPNPMGTLQIIFTKTAGFTLLCTGVMFCCYYAVSSSLPSQFHKGYGLNDLQISLMFLPFAGGGIISAFTSGRLFDWNFARHCKRLGLPISKNRQLDLSNFPIEQARLEIAIPLIGIGAVGLMAYGWTIAQRVSLAAPCVFLFLVGYSITASFNCMAILMVDMYPGKPATATAANNLVRCWMGAGAAALVVPLADAVGFGWTATIAAVLWLLCIPVFWLLMKRGPRWRREAREAKDRKQLAKEEKRRSMEKPEIENEHKEESNHEDQAVDDEKDNGMDIKRLEDKV